MASGVELEYAEITSTFTSTSTTSTGADVTGLSISVDVGSNPIEIIVQAENFSGSNGFGVAVVLNEDGTNIGKIASAAQNVVMPLHATKRLNPSAGTHIYQVKVLQLGAGTMTITAGVGTGQLDTPAYVQAVEL